MRRTGKSLDPAGNDRTISQILLISLLICVRSQWDRSAPFFFGVWVADDVVVNLIIHSKNFFYIFGRFRSPYYG